MTEIALQSKSGKKSYLQVLLLSMGHFFNDFYCNFLPILLPILIPKLGLSLTLSGVLVMVMSFTANVLQPVFGYMMDKYNFNKLMPFLIPFGAVFICMTSWVNEFWLLAVLIAVSVWQYPLFIRWEQVLSAKSHRKENCPRRYPSSSPEAVSVLLFRRFCSFILWKLSI